MNEQLRAPAAKRRRFNHSFGDSNTFVNVAHNGNIPNNGNSSNSNNNGNNESSIGLNNNDTTSINSMTSNTKYISWYL